MSDDHQDIAILFISMDHIHMHFHSITVILWIAIIELWVKFNILNIEFLGDIYSRSSSSHRWTCHDTIRTYSNQSEIVRDDLIRIFSE